MVRHVSKRRKLRKLGKRRRVKPWVLTPELKYHDTGFGTGVTLPVGSAASLTSLNKIAQGDSQNQRVGMRINVTSVQVKLRFQLQQSTSTGNSSQVRIIIAVDKQCNGANPVELNLLSTTDDISSLRKPETAKKYRILLDKTYFLNAQGLAWNGVGESGSQVTEGCMFFKRLQLPIYYSAAAAAVTSVTQNNLFYMIYTNVTSPVTTLYGNIRLRYTDL